MTGIANLLNFIQGVANTVDPSQPTQGPNMDGSAGQAPNPNDLGTWGTMAAYANGDGLQVQRLQQLAALAQKAQNPNSGLSPADIYKQADTINADPTDIAQRQSVQNYIQQNPNGNLQGMGTSLAGQTGDMTMMMKMPDIAAKIAEANKNNAQAAEANANVPKIQSQTITTPSGAPLMPGQKDVDGEFAKTYTSFANGGGEKNLQIANNVLDDTINGLKNGTIQTGRLMDRMATDQGGHQNYIGKSIDPQVLNAQSRVNTAVLPLLKPLFGARVTNYDAQSAIQSMGLNPMQSNDENIKQLTNLKNRMAASHDDLLNSGQYFQKNGTLAGYGGNGGAPMGQTADPGTQAPQASQSQKVATQADVQATARASGKSVQEVMQALQQKGYTIQ